MKKIKLTGLIFLVTCLLIVGTAAQVLIEAGQADDGTSSTEQRKMVRNSSDTILAIYHNDTWSKFAFSKDNGTTWTLRGNITNSAVGADCLANGAIDLTGNNEYPYVVCSSSFIFKSQDGGLNWEAPALIFMTSLRPDIECNDYDDVCHIGNALVGSGIEYEWLNTTDEDFHQVVLPSTANPSYPDIAVDRNDGMVCMSWTDETDLILNCCNQSADNCSVASEWIYGNHNISGALGSADKPLRRSSAFDDNQNLTITWYARAGIQYITFDGTENTTTAIATLASGDDSYYPSVSIQSSENMSIFYYNTSGDDSIWIINKSAGSWNSPEQLLIETGSNYQSPAAPSTYSYYYEFLFRNDTLHDIFYYNITSASAKLGAPDTSEPNIANDYEINETYLQDGEAVRFNVTITDDVYVDNVFFEIDGTNYTASNTSSEWYYINYFCNSSTLGNRTWDYIWADDSSANENKSTLSGMSFMCDNEAPEVDLNSPSNDTTSSTETAPSITFEFNTSDFYDENMTCNLTVNSIVWNQWSNNASNDSTLDFTNSSMKQGTYNWNVTCSDNSDNINTSETFILIIQITGGNAGAGGGGGGGTQQEICDDGYDNDRDQLFDCDDPDCENASNCKIEEELPPIKPEKPTLSEELGYQFSRFRYWFSKLWKDSRFRFWFYLLLFLLILLLCYLVYRLIKGKTSRRTRYRY